MRFMMLMFPGPKAETGAMPDDKLVAKMMKYNEELAGAGVLLGLDGLHPTAKGARVRFEGGKARVVDGPFTESKEIVGGYWLIEVKNKAEAIEWARRAPCPDGETIEIRQIFDAADFGPEVAAQEDAMQERIGRNLAANKR